LTCPTRPGGAGTTARLAIQEGGATIPGGELVLHLAACPDQEGPLPQLCNAAPGSTAATSGGLEGIWIGPAGPVLFAPDGRFMARNYERQEFWAGQWTASDPAWFPSSAEHVQGSVVEAFTSSGTYVPFTTVAFPGADGYSASNYAPANALAVAQVDAADAVGVAGAYGMPGAYFTLTVDGSGAFTGRLDDPSWGSCTLTGTITVLEPPKNMLAVELVASGGSCRMWQSSPLTGLGYVVAFQIETTISGPRYGYQLSLLVGAAGHYYGLVVPRPAE
jgi:hypothetical protein